ncbi:MAG: AAA family ATPase [Muribaculaceae bacterium]|nr:AAA family ATPase [Muribaculaceae bacterium]
MRKDRDNGIALEDVQLERALLVALFTDIYATNAIRQLQGIVMEDDFTTDEFAETWKVIMQCYNKGKEISPLNIYSVGKEMGIDVDIKRYLSRESLFADAETIGRTLHGLGQRRRMADKVQDIYLSLIYDNETTNEQIIAQLDKVVKDMTATSDTNVETFRDVYRQLLKTTQDKANGLLPQGVQSGFSLIDRKGGLERGELMVIAGRNSNGKTSLALCIALNASMSGEAVGIFSLEMTNLQLTTRLTSLLTGIAGESLKRGQLTDEEWDKFVAVNDSAPIYFDKRRSTDGDTLINNIKAMVAQLGVQIVVIDYLQLLRGKERERLQQIGGIAHKLEALSKQLGITIILLSQLRRNQPNDPTPKLEELKESGDIADASDSIYLVYRPERHSETAKYPDMSQNWSQYPTNGTALLMCVKNRQGSMNGEQLLAFDASTTRFYEKNILPVVDDGNDLPKMEDIFND